MHFIKDYIWVATIISVILSTIGIYFSKKSSSIKRNERNQTIFKNHLGSNYNTLFQGDQLGDESVLFYRNIEYFNICEITKFCYKVGEFNKSGQNFLGRRTRKLFIELSKYADIINSESQSNIFTTVNSLLPEERIQLYEKLFCNKREYLKKLKHCYKRFYLSFNDSL